MNVDNAIARLERQLAPEHTADHAFTPGNDLQTCKTCTWMSLNHPQRPELMTALTELRAGKEESVIDIKCTLVDTTAPDLIRLLLGL